MMKISTVLTVCSFALGLAGCETQAWHSFTQPLPPTPAEARVLAGLADLDRRLTELEGTNSGHSRKVTIESGKNSDIGELSTLSDDHGDGPIAKVAKKSDKKKRAKTGGDDLRPALSLSAKVQPSHSKKTPGFMEASAPTDCVSGIGCAGVSVAKGRFAVHLASYKHMRYLERGWSRLQEQFPALLASREPRAKRFTRDDGAKYIRLKAGPFETRQQAYDLCNKLKARQVYCALSRFDGFPLDGYLDL